MCRSTVLRTEHGELSTTSGMVDSFVLRKQPRSSIGAVRHIYESQNEHVVFFARNAYMGSKAFEHGRHFMYEVAEAVVMSPSSIDLLEIAILVT